MCVCVLVCFLYCSRRCWGVVRKTQKSRKVEEPNRLYTPPHTCMHTHTRTCMLGVFQNRNMFPLGFMPSANKYPSNAGLLNLGYSAHKHKPT